MLTLLIIDCTAEGTNYAYNPKASVMVGKGRLGRNSGGNIQSMSNMTLYYEFMRNGVCWIGVPTNIPLPNGTNGLLEFPTTSTAVNNAGLAVGVFVSGHYAGGAYYSAHIWYPGLSDWAYVFQGFFWGNNTRWANSAYAGLYISNTTIEFVNSNIRARLNSVANLEIWPAVNGVAGSPKPWYVGAMGSPFDAAGNSVYSVQWPMMLVDYDTQPVNSPSFTDVSAHVNYPP
jgi:hypothetical protein